MASQPTTTGTRKLSEVCRKLVVPSGIVSTGWPQIDAVCRDKLGIGFDDWQQGAGRVVLAKRADGRLACMIGGVGMSVCRQVGKTYFWGGLFFGLAVARPGFLAIWSAHHSRTHGETFLAMQSFARRKRIAPYIENVYKGSGDEAIVFRNGSRILFGARERGFGRGIPGVDAIMADEGQIMSERALDDQLATLNTSEFGLFASVGTPPRPEDPSEGFSRMRKEAWDGTLEDAVWIEIGAEPGTDPNDRKQWSKWNPSHPKRTPAESILRLQRKLSPESFLREGMGMWDEEGSNEVFGAGKWAACRLAKDVKPDRGLAVGVAVSLDRAWSSVGVAAPHRDRIVVGANERRRGVSWLAEYLRDIQSRRGCPVVMDGKGPGSALIPDLEAAGVQLTIASTSDLLDACAGMFDRVQTKTLAHMGHADLDEAVAGAVKRDIGDRWAWGRRKSVADVSMLEAVTFAAWEVWRHDQYDVLDSVH